MFMGSVRQITTIEGNEAAAFVAYKTNEVVAIYPITPSSPMSELADQWSAAGEKNLWGSVPQVQEMQAEGGAAGAIHGALQVGSLATTFTSSQGLLLMIPNMYKIAGELTSTVFHIAARSLATQGLSIFGDHSDVMATRATGWAMLFANSVQEVMDFALVSQACTLKARVPFLHVFDGFRTSHEISKIEALSDEDIRTLIDDDLVREHRARALSPDHPFIRGTAQNPDTFFQAREASNSFYLAVPEIVQGVMDQFAKQVGRSYHLFDYVGAPDAERVVVAMASACETVEETVNYLNAHGEKVGLVKVRLYRPFSGAHFMAALPITTKVIAVLDRTKEPGSIGEPLYQDVVTALSESRQSLISNFQILCVIGGRYGLSSKEFTPTMAKAVFDELSKPQPKNHFTVGIHDDVTHTSLSYDPDFTLEASDTVRAMFWGLGSDGTVGANKNSIKIIGEETDNYAQGYFVYDSKKAGARTISHLRFGPRPIRSPYLIQQATFIAVHQFNFLERYDTLEHAAEGATVLLNSPHAAAAVWQYLSRMAQDQVLARRLKLFVIDADKVARENGMGSRINTVMQACFFALSGVLPRDEAIAKIKDAIRKTYGKRGEAVVRQNFAAVDASLANLFEVPAPSAASTTTAIPLVVPTEAPQFVQNVTAMMMAGKGGFIPVSALPVDGTYPSATTQWERRNLADEVPVWDPNICIQCGKCVLVCPHAVIRGKVFDPADLANAPETFKSADARWKELPDKKYALQVSVEDCTGCTLCVEVCPVKDKSNTSRRAINMQPQQPLRETEKKNWEFFLGLPDLPSPLAPLPAGEAQLKFSNVKNVQLMRPLFEFSGACAGCGETPYLKLLSQLFGDRAVIANATGCSSIYGGNLPTTPWAKNAQGRGPAWSNSLFENNAEFGMGMRLALDTQATYARTLVQELREVIGIERVDAILAADQSNDVGIEMQRERVTALKRRLEIKRSEIEHGRQSLISNLLSLADALVKKSVWIVGGDGWAYDIGYGGLDHVLASGRKVNVLVLDTEVYSNTGGQSSKATPLGAVAKFAAGGKSTSKKDLGLLATDCGYWSLYRFNPALTAEGKNPLQLDSGAPKIPFKDYALNETRYRVLGQLDAKAAENFMQQAQQRVTEHWKKYEELAGK